jgi:hypothetical protein
MNQKNEAHIFENIAAQEYARRSPPKLPPLSAVEHQFECLGEFRYRLTVPELGIKIEVNRLRREHQELFGELSVWCTLPGARTIDDHHTLSVSEFNLSSIRTRTERAKFLAQRAQTGDLDWPGLIEEFCVRVLVADRDGNPMIDLRTVAVPQVGDEIDIGGLYLLRQHPTVLFGDGGSAKSYLALYLGGLLVERGFRVGVWDWELASEDHRVRLERLFPDGMPRILYGKCEKPLSYEIDRIRRLCRLNEIQFAIFDSVAFACDGPPESAEIAGRYFRCVRGLDIGSLHVAHVSKAEGADQRPFGSAFWHNGARSTWYVQLAEGGASGSQIQIGLFNRKNNLSKLRPPLSYAITFDENRTAFRRTDIADNPDLAAKMTIRQRMQHLLRQRAMTPEEIAEELDADAASVKRTIRRYGKTMFIVLDGGKVGNR